MLHRVNVQTGLTRESFAAFTTPNLLRVFVVNFHFGLHFLLRFVNLNVIPELLHVFETFVAVRKFAAEVLLRRMNLLVEVLQPRQNRRFKAAELASVEIHVDLVQPPEVSVQSVERFELVGLAVWADDCSIRCVALPMILQKLLAREVLVAVFV